MAFQHLRRAAADEIATSKSRDVRGDRILVTLECHRVGNLDIHNYIRYYEAK